MVYCQSKVPATLAKIKNVMAVLVFEKIAISSSDALLLNSVNTLSTVSYTHLTLPTKRIV